MKEEWDKAIEDGSQRHCPQCGIACMKDDECTHIKCPKCKTNWCYVCGEASYNCDTSDYSGDLFRHNDDWKTNPKRCPMNLCYISEVDSRWPSDGDEPCRMFLHKILTLRKIRDFIYTHGKSKYKKLCNAFPSVAQSGFIKYDVLSLDLTIIKR